MDNQAALLAACGQTTCFVGAKTGQQQSGSMGSPSTGLVLRASVCGDNSQRRESFLYRTSDNDYEVSPKSISRHSSIGSEW